ERLLDEVHRRGLIEDETNVDGQVPGDLEQDFLRVPNPETGWGKPIKPMTAGELLQELMQRRELKLERPVEVLLFLGGNGIGACRAHTFLVHGTGYDTEEGMLSIHIGDFPGDIGDFPGDED